VRKVALYFLYAFWLLCPSLLGAMHIIGGEITYECLGTNPSGNNYRFRMLLYRDCNSQGAQFDANAQFAIYRGTYQSARLVRSFSVQLGTVLRLPVDTPRCVSSIPSVCVQSGEYIFNQSLEILSDDSYFIVYQRCCRNNTISNLVNPGELGATYLVEITAEGQRVCSNSPVFKKFPPIVICNALPLEFDHGARDKENDQLSYKFCNPLNGGGNILSPPGLTSCLGAVPTPPCGPDSWDNVPFIVPAYTPERPMGGDPVISIDDSTGFITGKPNRLGQFVVGVCVEEYRNGKLLSRVRRDFQFNVADCKPQVVAAIVSDTTLRGRNYVLNACGQNTVNFKNESRERRFITSFEWRFNIKGQAYSNKTDWEPSISFPDTGLYRGGLYLNPGTACADTAFISLNVFPGITANFDFKYDTCVAGPVAFTDLSKSLGVINRWQWNFAEPGVAPGTTQNPQHRYKVPGAFPVRLRVTDRNRCSDDTTRLVRWFPAPSTIIVQPDNFKGCQPANIFFNNRSNPLDSTYKIEWDFGDGKKITGPISPTHTYTESGLYDVKLRITSPIGCVVEAEFPRLIRVEPSPTADFTYSPDSMLSNYNNVIQFTDRSLNANRWSWMFDRLGTSTQRSPTFTFIDTGLMRVTLIVTHPEGCQDSLTKVLDFVPIIRWFMPNAFTPNNDGINEGFLGKGALLGISDFRMSIWNRWGEAIFETTDPEEAWNGRPNNTGDLSPSGVYVYLVTFTGPRGEKLRYKGFATLVR
jgi:gliding motility-associated-like protein